MDDLITFLRARLDEIEARVRALPEGPWEWRSIDESGPAFDELVGPTGESVLSSSDTEGYCSWITRHETFDAYLQDVQPARVLAEADAKRRVVALHEAADHEYAEGPVCLSCDQGGPLPYPCPTVRLLALPYADHPDYREEWKL